MSPVESAYTRYTEDKYGNDLGGQLVRAADLATLAANYGSEKRLAEARQKDFLRLYETNKKNEQLSKARFDAWMDAMKREEDALRLLDLAKREIKHLEETALETRNKRDKTEDSLRADLKASNRQVEELQERLKAIEARSLEISEIKKSQKDIGVINASTTGCHLVQFHPDANRALKPQPGERIAIIPAVVKTPVVDELQECIDAVRAVYPGATANQGMHTGDWSVWAMGGGCLASRQKTREDAWKAAKNNLPKPVSDDEKFVKEHYPNAKTTVRNGWCDIEFDGHLCSAYSADAAWNIAKDWIRGENEKKQLDADIAFVRKVFPSAAVNQSFSGLSVFSNGLSLALRMGTPAEAWKTARQYVEKWTTQPVAKV